jgi:hypothetical protein
VSELERNVDALVRAAGARPRPDAAKARFLAAVAARPRRPWPLALAAAALVAATLVAVSERTTETGARQRPDATPAQDPGWAALRPLVEDPTVALRARLPAPRARSPLLRIEGSADLPDGFKLFISVQRNREAFDGVRLAVLSDVAGGGYGEVSRGRIGLDLAWPEPAPFLVRADMGPEHQGPEVQALMKKGYPVRVWTFVGSGWGDGLLDGLAPAGGEIDAAAAELLALVKEVEAACATKERWLRESPRLRPSVRALRERLEKGPGRDLLPAASGVLLGATRNLDGDAQYFDWTAEGFQGPVSYHADRQKMKTYRAEAWTFAALRRYAEEARGVADREIALWLVKDLRRAGPRPVPDALWTRPGVARWRERLGGVDGLDALEEEIRAGR